MIWYEETLQAKDQPEEATLTAIGKYNPPGSNLPMITLQIHVELKPGDTLIVKTAMEKNPAILGAHEEPNPDDIGAKYYRQVLKLRDKIEKTPFQEILDW